MTGDGPTINFNGPIHGDVHVHVNGGSGIPGGPGRLGGGVHVLFHGLDALLLVSRTTLGRQMLGMGREALQSLPGMVENVRRKWGDRNPQIIISMPDGTPPPQPLLPPREDDIVDAVFTESPGHPPPPADPHAPMIVINPATGEVREVVDEAERQTFADATVVEAEVIPPKEEAGRTRTEAAKDFAGKHKAGFFGACVASIGSIIPNRLLRRVAQIGGMAVVAAEVLYSIANKDKPEAPGLADELFQRGKDLIASARHKDPLENQHAAGK